jgi:hypothetical protein
MEDISANRIFKMLSYHTFHNIYIINQELEVGRIVTEAELVDAVLTKGYMVKLKDIG